MNCIEDPNWQPVLLTKLEFNYYPPEEWQWGIVISRTAKTLKIQLVEKEEISSSGNPTYNTKIVKPNWSNTTSVITAKYYKGKHNCWCGNINGRIYTLYLHSNKENYSETVYW